MKAGCIVGVLFVAAGCGGGGADTTPATGRPGWKHPQGRIVADAELEFELETEYGAELAQAIGTPESSYVVWDGPIFGDDGAGAQIVALDEDGQQRWSQDFDRTVVAWPIEDDLMVFVDTSKFPDTGGTLQRIAGDTGAQRWQIPVAAVVNRSADFDNRAFASDGENLTAIDLDSGEQVASKLFDAVGNVNDIGQGGIAAIDGDDVLVLDRDLHEMTRITVPGVTGASYSNGQILVSVDFATTKLYDDDGAELDSINLDVMVDDLIAVGNGVWAYGEILAGACGAVSATDEGLEQLWQQDRCQLLDVGVLDDGQAYVNGAWGVFDAVTGEPVAAIDGRADIGDDGFFSVRLGGCSAVSADGEVVFTLDDVEAASLLDGGYAAVVDDPDTTEQRLRVYGAAS